MTADQQRRLVAEGTLHAAWHVRSSTAATATSVPHPDRGEASHREKPANATMTPPGPDRPEPPFSVEFLADLHTGALSDDVAAYVVSRLDDDPHARRVLAALDRTVADLGSAPLGEVNVPQAVADRTSETLAAIRAESASAEPLKGDPVDSQPQHLAPVVARQPIAPPRHGRARGRRALVAALVAASIVVIAVAAVGLIMASQRTPSTRPVQAAPSAQTRSGTVPAPPTLDHADRPAAVSVLGRVSGAPFGSIAALRRCTAANGVPPDTPVLGSGPVRIGGADRIVILLGTGVAGRFIALVVERGCDTGNPATLSRTTIGG